MPLRAALLATLALAAVARADGDDAAFGRALAQRGYADLATRVLVRAANDPATPPARRSECLLALAQVRRAEALGAMRVAASSADAAARAAKLLDEAAAAFRALTGDPANGRVARHELVRLLLAIAESRTGSPPEKAARALDEALRTASEARAAATDDEERASIRLLEIEALVAKGRSLPPGNPARSQPLTRALDEIEAFTWDYAGTLRCAFGFRWRGRALVALQRWREGCESLRDAATSVTEKDGVPAAADMCLAAYEDLAAAALAARGAEASVAKALAVETLTHLAADWPRHLELAAGRRARLAAARLALASGDAAGAARDARAVLVAAGERDPESADAACALIADAAASPGGASAADVDPALLAQFVRAALRRGELDRAAASCRALAAAATSPETRDRFVWDAWDALGRAYGAAGRWREAYDAFEEIERAWRAEPSNARLGELTDTTAYLRADALGRRAAETKDAADSAAAERAMSEFARDHPGSSFASGAREQRAFRALAEAAALRRAGDRANAVTRANEAFAALESIPAESAMRDRAEALLAEAHRLLGRPDEAIRAAEAWLASSRPEPQSAGARRSRDLGRTQAIVTLLTATADRASALTDETERRRAFAGLLALADRHGDELVRLAPRAAADLASWRAEALLATGETDAAAAIVNDRIKVGATDASLRYLASLIARADEAAAERAPDAAAARPRWLRAARLWEHVLETADSPDPAVAAAAGRAFRLGGDLARAAEVTSLAAGLYRGRADRSRDGAERADATAAADAASRELASLFVALGRYAEAETETAALLTRGDDAGAAILVRLAGGETLSEADVAWVVARAARDRAALDLAAAAWSGRGTKESLSAAARAIAALRYTLPRDAAPTAESVDLALRHAEALAACAAAGGPADGGPAAAALLDEAFGAPDAVATAERLVPGAKLRIDDLGRRLTAAGLRK